MTDARQRHGGRILDFPKLVQDRVYPSDNGRKRLHVLGQLAQGRVVVFRKFLVAIVLVQEVHNDPNRFQRPAQVPQLVLLQVRVLQSDASHRFAHVKEIVHGHLLCCLHQPAELAYLFHPVVHRHSVVGEGQFVHLFLAQRAQTMLLQQMSYLVKSYLRFVVLWVNHATKVRKLELICKKVAQKFG